MMTPDLMEISEVYLKFRLLTFDLIYMVAGIDEISALQQAARIYAGATVMGIVATPMTKRKRRITIAHA